MNVVKQIFLLVLALVVFTTSSCFAVDVHMCKGNVKSQAFFRSAVACDQMSEIEKEELPACCKKIRDAKIAQSSSKCLFKKKTCCFNCSFEYKSHQNSCVQNFSAVFFDVDGVLAFNGLNSEGTYKFNDVVASFFKGKPPSLLRRNFQSLYQVYLI